MNKQRKMRIGIAAIANLFNYAVNQPWFYENYESLYDYELMDSFTLSDLITANSEIRVYNHYGNLISREYVNKSWCGRSATLYETKSSIIEKYTNKNKIDYEWISKGKPDEILPKGRTFVFLLFEEDEIKIISTNPYKGKAKEGIIPSSISFEEREKIIIKDYIF